MLNPTKTEDMTFISDEKINLGLSGMRSKIRVDKMVYNLQRINERRQQISESYAAAMQEMSKMRGKESNVFTHAIGAE